MKKSNRSSKSVKPTESAATDKETVLIELSALTTSTLNVRQHDKSSVETMYKDIVANGVIQNLAVVDNGDGTFGVVAGARRLRALLLGVERVTWPLSRPVPCIIVTKDEARRYSYSENHVREDMHPADAFLAFKASIDAGMSIDEVAASFHETAAVVQQRLKLANVAPELLELYREGKATLEQMIALAISDDHEAQRRVWKAARQEWQRSAHELRAALTVNEVEFDRSSVAKYVGLAAYEKAGGVVRRDLFSPSQFLTDPALLERLAQAKLDKKATELRKEYSWVETRLRADYQELATFDQLRPFVRDLTKKEEQQVAKREAERAELIERLDSDEVEASERRTGKARLRELNELDEKLDKSREFYEPKALALAGALVTIESDGKAVVHRDLIRRKDRALIAKLQNGGVDDVELGAGTSGDADFEARQAGTPEPARGGISDALTRRLSIERTLALRATLSLSPRDALSTLVHALVAREFFDSQDTVLDLRLTDALSDKDIRGDSRAAASRQAQRHELASALPSSASGLWHWIIDQDIDTLLKYLSYCVASAVNAVMDRGSSTHTYSNRPIAASNDLAALLKFDMANWWEATPSTYLGSVSKSLLVEAVRETRGDEAAKAIPAMAKSDAINAAASALQGTRWLPALLR